MEKTMEFLVYFLVFYIAYIILRLCWEGGGQTILGTILFIALICGFGALLNAKIVQYLITYCIIIGCGISLFKILSMILLSILDSINRFFKNKNKEIED
jgi:hypothetical protein